MNKLKTMGAMLLLTIMSIATFAQESSKTFTAKNFKRLSVSSGIDLYITQGSAEALTVKSSPELLKEVEVVQEGDKVTIRYKDNTGWRRAFNRASTKAYITVKTLNELNASGGSDVSTQGTLKTDDLRLRASGGADLKMTVACKNLDVSVSGGSDADLSGTVENLVAHSSGGSDLKAYNLQVQNAKVNSSGGSDAYVNVAKALDAAASGGSDIHYKGNPSVKKSTSGGSDVNRSN